MGEAIEIQRVVGFGHTQVVVSNTIFFMRNCRIVTADEVQFISKTVLVDTCRVLFDKVLLTGRLRKNVAFRETAPCFGNVAPVGGVMAEVGFQTSIDLRGARPGDSCVVVKALVEGEEEKPLTQTPGGGIKGLVDSSLLFLCVKVVRPEVFGIHDHPCADCRDSSTHDDRRRTDSGDEDSSCDCKGTWSGSSTDISSAGETRPAAPAHHATGCPQRKTAGLVAGEHGIVPDAQPGPRPGSFVGPTILFPGVF